MGSQMIQIIVLAGIALFLFLRLRNVLGTRDGFEKPTKPIPDSAKSSPRQFEVIEGGTDPDIAHFVDPESASGKALAAMKRTDHDFSAQDFSLGARQAYEMILMAYENGDLESLKKFLSDQVFEPFQRAINERNEKGYTVEASFVGVREVKLIRASFNETTSEADITMQFIGELVSAVRDTEGAIVEGDANTARQQKDIWTFSRIMTSDDPNWLLTGTVG